MNFKPDVVGRGYLQACLRVENRPGRPPRPEDKDEILERLEALHAAGVPAWWYSVSAKGSHPLFPSKVLPHHPDAVPGMYEWLAEEVHKRDMVLCSWEYLCTAPYLMKQHPEYGMEFLDKPLQMSEEDRKRARERHDGVFKGVNPVPCYLSPYGDMLKEFCVEVFEDLGFDAIWFDGCFMSATNTTPGMPMGCCCPRCTAKFGEDTGLEMPRVEDWDNPDFRVFIKWRYDFFGDYWRSLCDHVRSRREPGVVCLNHFQRLGHPTGFGGPLNHLDIDALVTAEVDQAYYQNIMQLKYLRAISNRHVQENWASQQPSGPNADPNDMAYFGMLCMTGGGHMALGLGARPKDQVTTLAAIVEQLEPRAPYGGGEPFRYIGIVLSSNTKDFAFGGDDMPTWRSVHGIHNIFMAAHLPSEIILDNQVTVEHLQTFPLGVLSDIRCLSDAQATALTAYVEQGGLLLITGEVGTLDDLGWPRENGALDELIGITNRCPERVPPPLIAPAGDWASGLADAFHLGGSQRGQPEGAFRDLVWAEFGDDVEILAHGAHAPIVESGRSEGPELDDPDLAPPAIVTRQVGKGRVIYVNRDVGGFYSHTPSRQYRDVIIALLSAYSEPPYDVEAMPHVAVTAWKQLDGRIFIHMLSQIHELLYIPSTVGRPALNMGEAPPSGPITLTLPWQVSAVSRPVTGGPVDLEVADGISTIRIENVDKHDVLVVE